MPRKRIYQKHKSDLEWMEEKRAYDRVWIKSKRSRRPFTHFSKKLRNRTKAEISPFQFWRIAKRQRLVCPLTGRRLTGETISLIWVTSANNTGKAMPLGRPLT